jgi:hypothetical protein
MNNFLLALGVFAFLFILLFISCKIGYWFGMWRKGQGTQSQLGIVKVAEGTVFALFGLLVAFSFSGAYTRFEERKIKIIDEVNAIEVAYHRIDLLKPALQPVMRTLIKNYIDDRIATYKRLAEFHGFYVELETFKQVQNRVWLQAVDATQQTADHAVTLLFIPAINNMLDIANTRIMITRIHPPIPIFMLLIGLGALSAFLAGYSMARKQKYSLVYALCFVGVTAFTLYVIIDLEFPRMGMIRVDAFDYLLLEARDGLQ